MQSLLQGYEEDYGNDEGYGTHGQGAWHPEDIGKKEDEAQDAHFVLYKMQNILAFLLVVGVILMDLFHFNIAETSASEILMLLTGNFPVTEFFGFVMELPVFSDLLTP